MKKTGWGAFAALILAACAAASAHAGEAIETPELLVSGGIEPIPTKEVASSYTIVTAEEIEKFQYQDITDALRPYVAPGPAPGGYDCCPPPPMPPPPSPQARARQKMLKNIKRWNLIQESRIEMR